MSSKKDDKVKKIVNDILDDKLEGAVIAVTDMGLAFKGSFNSTLPDMWQLASTAGYELMEDVLEHKEEHKDVVLKLVRRYMKKHNIKTPVESKVLKKVKELKKEIEANPDKIGEILERVAKESGMDIKATKIDLDSKSSKDFLKNMPDIIASAKLCAQVADNWIKQNKGNHNVMEFWDKHGRIFHNTPNGAIFPCGKTYTVDGGADASDHVENCKYCSDLLDSFEKVKKIKEAREK